MVHYPTTCNLSLCLRRILTMSPTNMNSQKGSRDAPRQLVEGDILDSPVQAGFSDWEPWEEDSVSLMA
jgi:hypothetical protein